jgi:phosphopantothenoylcysteine decarboxylase/phosphopantothenate--cysteine ligase
MASAAVTAAVDAQLFVAAAAVADQRPDTRAPQKVKKREGEETLTLVRTPDVLAHAVASAGEPRPIFVGFAAETEQVVANATEKLQRKGLDLIAANDVSGPAAGFATLTNRLTLIDRSGQVRELPEASKEDLAHALLDQVVEIARARKE